MKIAIAGGSGFLGQPLVERLVAKGHDVVVLSRDPAKVRAGRGVAWDPRTQGPWATEVADADVVVNLAGENVGERRWTAERKRRLVASRLDSTKALVTAMQQQPGRQRTIVNASATGFYGPRGDETLDENGSRGSGFLADLVEKWEAAAREAEGLGRLVVLRFGVVLAKEGGALAKMLLPFKLGAGGPVGTGTQWMAWVAREDAVRAIEWAIETGTARGVYNVTSPEPVRNRDFTRVLGRAVRRPAFMPVPAFALRAAFGEMADETVLTGQRVIPKRLEAEGFRFTYPSIDAALEHVVRGS